jgi:hypothetical protein
VRFKLHLSFDERTIAKLDRARGQENRSSFVERILLRHLDRNDFTKDPEPEQVDATKFFKGKA